MNCEQIEIWQQGEYQGVTPDAKPFLETYVMKNKDRRPAVLVLPGGGYSFVSPREAEPIAVAFNAMGYQAFVLTYSIAPNVHPQPLMDASRAMCIIRDRAEEWMVDPDRIAVIGFSAGGHLAGSLAVFWNDPQLLSMPGMEYGKNKPNAVILAYPVINPASHIGSFQNLLGQTCGVEQMPTFMDLEKHVHGEVPPAFLWHTFQDATVDVAGALSFATALRLQNIPFELHVYPWGHHGYSLATTEMCDDPNPHIATWFGLCGQWLEQLFHGSKPVG